MVYVVRHVIPPVEECLLQSFQLWQNKTNAATLGFFLCGFFIRLGESQRLPPRCVREYLVHVRSRRELLLRRYGYAQASVCTPGQTCLRQTERCMDGNGGPEVCCPQRKIPEALVDMRQYYHPLRESYGVTTVASKLHRRYE